MNNEMTNTLPFKVKCTYIDNDCLTVGKEYSVVEVDDGFYEVKNDSGEFWWYHNNRFETLDRESNPKDKQEFSVGDKVYVGLTGRMAKVTEIIDDEVVSVANENNEVRVWTTNICHATQENYEMLSKLYPHIEIELPTKQLTNGNLCRAVLSKPYPHIEFELPPKEITGSDLCRTMLDKGWHLVPCVVSDISDSDALNNDNCCLVDEWCFGYFENDSCRYKYAVPFDPKTGVPLTEDVLNEKI